MKIKPRVIGAFFLLMAILMLAGCTEETSAPAEAEEREVPVKVAPASFGSLSGSNILSGTIIAEDEAEVSPKVSGEVQEILVEKGDTVERGQAIAKLDNFDERNALEQQKAALKQAKANLESAKNGKSTAENNLKQAQASLDQAKASLKEAKKSQSDNLDNIEFQIKNAEIALQQSEQNFKRVEQLYNEGLTSEQNYDDAKTAVDNARNSLEQVKQQKQQADSEVALESLKASVKQAEVGVEIARDSIDDAQAPIDQAQAGVESARLNVEAAQERLDDKTITAPIAGEVTDIAFEVGEMASPQSPFATIIALDQVKVSVNVLPEQLSTFEIGDEVEVQVDGVSDAQTATVSYISAVSSGSGLFTVEADLDSQDRKIRPGMVASIVLDEVLAADSILVPTEAIVQKEGLDVVFVVEDGKAVQKQVEVIRYGTEMTAVGGDLQEDNQVVISGQNLLEDGNLVKIMEEE
ncbi:efflux RND transporter periplasmic adaptor subunit [Oceanobacillus senegalensis]|uniref:efflux RND transporter periplasmic adaptor subunit n=1 Tax=Oceanobacillus senegalensis TaxID=1936063 RepID=UPI000A309688|nr:efflux RND transporter periplasmic adaptor subunit [Oceanobacillus senegalensis]